MQWSEKRIVNKKIGELWQKTGVDVETIRYYEKVGILPEPARTEGNYRHYNEQHADRLSFVRYCRSLDMTLDEIRVLLQFRHPHRFSAITHLSSCSQSFFHSTA